MKRPDDPYAHLRMGIHWATRIFALGLNFVLPPLGGLALDWWWGTRPWGLLGGMVIGFVLGLAQLLQIAARPQDADRPSP